MGTISTRQVAGLSLVVGPLVAVVCYFIQQFGVSPDIWTDPASVAAALAGGGALTVVTSIVIPIAIGGLVFGIFFIADGIVGNGNGDALARYSKLLILIGFAGFVYGSGTQVLVANYPEATSAVYTGWAISGVSGVFFSLGFLAIFLAMASRAEYNAALANAAAGVAVVAVVCSIIGTASKDLNQVMTLGVGITYLIHTIYAIYLGRTLCRAQ